MLLDLNILVAQLKKQESVLSVACPFLLDLRILWLAQTVAMRQSSNTQCGKGSMREDLKIPFGRIALTPFPTNALNRELFLDPRLSTLVCLLPQDTPPARVFKRSALESLVLRRIVGQFAAQTYHLYPAKIQKLNSGTTALNMDLFEEQPARCVGPPPTEVLASIHAFLQFPEANRLRDVCRLYYSSFASRCAKVLAKGDAEALPLWRCCGRSPVREKEEAMLGRARRWRREMETRRITRESMAHGFGVFFNVSGGIMPIMCLALSDPEALRRSARPTWAKGMRRTLLTSSHSAVTHSCFGGI